MNKSIILLFLLLLALMPAWAAGEGRQDEQQIGFAAVKSEHASIFREIKKEGSGGKYKISGESRTSTGTFYYAVEDGHNELIPETEVRLSSSFPQWSKFSLSLTIPENKLPDNGSLTLLLYEQSNEGNMVHLYPVLLESFQ